MLIQFRIDGGDCSTDGVVVDKDDDDDGCDDEGGGGSVMTLIG